MRARKGKGEGGREGEEREEGVEVKSSFYGRIQSTVGKAEMVLITWSLNYVNGVSKSFCGTVLQVLALKMRLHIVLHFAPNIDYKACISSSHRVLPFSSLQNHLTDT